MISRNIPRIIGDVGLDAVDARAVALRGFADDAVGVEQRFNAVVDATKFRHER